MKVYGFFNNVEVIYTTISKQKQTVTLINPAKRLVSNAINTIIIAIKSFKKRERKKFTFGNNM
ncbi:hypothetical protein FACS189465_2760 [Clostridia bacterium]|nr:hypothetical protein FACS189465_2760 [Clostridia bacterium]